MAKMLHVRHPDGGRRKVDLEGDRLSLGRSHENDLLFPDDASLSRRHLVLEADGATWTVEDMKSKNGTLVNGTRISGKHVLKAGDRISAGQVVLVFDEPDGDPFAHVAFYAGSDADLPAGATVISSLDGMLSGERVNTISGKVKTPIAPNEDRGPFDHPAVVALLCAGRELAARRPLDELFGRILDLSIEAVGAERGIVMTLEAGGLQTRAVRGAGFRISSAVRDRVVQQKASLLVKSVLNDEALKDRMSIHEQNIRTLMAVPLQTDDRVIGLVYVDSPSMVREFTAQQLDLLTVLGNVAATRIEQERLAQVEIHEKLIQKELEAAGEIQRRLLPSRVPQVPGLDLAGYNAACRTVGGDYYDFFEYPDGRVALVVGDVSGKGMPAALLMATLHARVQVLAEDPASLSHLMSRLDRIMAINCPPNRFVTLFFSVIDPATGEMPFCNAGHNPPLVMRASGQVERLQGCGCMLGLFPEMGYEEKRVRLERGDLLVVFSDGVTEATDPNGEEYGEQRLADLCAGAEDMAADALMDKIIAALSAWTQDAPPTDDITLVLARRTK